MTPVTAGPRLLHVVASPRAERSESRRVSDALVARFAELHPDSEVDVLNLWHEPTNDFDASFVDAKMAVIAGRETEGPAATAWTKIEGEARRLLAADRVVITAPVWNGGVPWILKRWIDTITQPGLLFRFDPATGYHGLASASGRRAAVIFTSSVYADGRPPAFGRDFHRSYLEDWLGFIGIDHVQRVELWRTRPNETLDARRAGAILAAQEVAASL